MAGDRKELGLEFKRIPGVKKVYFQPPESIKLEYPCIIYNWSVANSDFANNFTYGFKRGYTVTIIDSNPDSKIPDEVIKFPLCRFDRHFVSNNLHHFVFRIYY